MDRAIRIATWEYKAALFQVPVPTAAENGEQGIGDRQLQRIAILGLVNPEVAAAHADPIPGELEYFSAA
ncbi:hypothetical protein D3C75_677060 [compost metagenome]